MRIITGAEALQDELDSLSLIGCRILSFDIEGRLWGWDHQSMLDCYNNCVAPEGGPYRKPDDLIVAYEISLDLERTRMLSTDGPCILGLDDGRVLEVTIPDFSQAIVRTYPAKIREGNEYVDAGKIMAPILGERISGITVSELSATAYERCYLDAESYPHPFKYVRIDCENHSLYLSYLTCAVMNNVEKLDPLGMTMGEFKAAISYYDELFDGLTAAKEDEWPK